MSEEIIEEIINETNVESETVEEPIKTRTRKTKNTRRIKESIYTPPPTKERKSCKRTKRKKSNQERNHMKNCKQVEQKGR